LPFEDGHFDAVITESVTSFPADKQLAVSEYARVIKPGGFVGLNESTWLKVPPSQELVEWVQQDVGATVEPLTAEGWKDLLVKAGLKDIVVILKNFDVKSESRGILRRYGVGGLLSMLAKAFRLYLRNPNYRQFVKEVKQGGLIPKDFDVYFGYGIFVGRKGF
jgi:SAM-dependent methyltransferase